LEGKPNRALDFNPIISQCKRKIAFAVRRLRNPEKCKRKKWKAGLSLTSAWQFVAKKREFLSGATEIGKKV